MRCNQLIGPVTANPNRTVKIHFHPRQSHKNAGPQTISNNIASAGSAHVISGNPPLTFWWYPFSTVVPITQGVSGFDVEVIDNNNGVTNSTMYKNGGQGFPFDDMIITQPKLSCSEVNFNGLMNLTVAVSHTLLLADIRYLATKSNKTNIDPRRFKTRFSEGDGTRASSPQLYYAGRWLDTP